MEIVKITFGISNSLILLGHWYIVHVLKCHSGQIYLVKVRLAETIGRSPLVRISNRHLFVRANLASFFWSLLSFIQMNPLQVLFWRNTGSRRLGRSLFLFPFIASTIFCRITSIIGDALLATQLEDNFLMVFMPLSSFRIVTLKLKRESVTPPKQQYQGNRQLPSGFPGELAVKLGRILWR